MKVKVKVAQEVEVTSENEVEILTAEYERRFGNAFYELGDDVVFTGNGRPKQIELMGGEHVGRPGIVTAIGQDLSVKVLAISADGQFVEVWTREDLVELVGEE